MNINIDALRQLAEERNWSIPELAARLNVEYSYLHRVLKGEKKGGGKLFAGIYNLCVEEGLQAEHYFGGDRVLSMNNEGRKISASRSIQSPVTLHEALRLAADLAEDNERLLRELYERKGKRG